MGLQKIFSWIYYIEYYIVGKWIYFFPTLPIKKGFMQRIILSSACNNTKNHTYM